MSAPVICDYSLLRGSKIPLITLGIFHNREWFPTQAYVDSGATYSIFSSKVADYIGLEYRKGRKINITVGSGETIATYLNRLKIQIGRNRIDALLGFSDELGAKINLLGRKDVFDHFKICFDEKNSQVVFYPFE